MTGRPGLAEAFAGAVDLPGLDGPGALAERQAGWREALAREIYGPVPDAPEALEVRVAPIPGERAERATIFFEERRGEPRPTPFTVDAALWRPEGDGPFPLIAGLSFAGPAGVLTGPAFPLDAEARVYSRPELGAEGRLTETLRGSEAHRWPVEWLNAPGFAVLVSCYGSWCPDDAGAFERQGLRPFLGIETRAISLWAWAISRLIDAAERIGGLETSQTVVAGHSRLGKAALWAAALDGRIEAVLANASGCGGSAPARHPVGETLRQMAEAYPHWILSQNGLPSVDQHQLLAAIAPRRVYLALAEADLWADPLGSVMALGAASRVWPGDMAWPSPEEIWERVREVHHADLGFHIRPGGHDLLPHDWHRFIAFLGKAN